jgi:hypothetical protein
MVEACSVVDVEEGAWHILGHSVVVYVIQNSLMYDFNSISPPGQYPKRHVNARIGIIVAGILRYPVLPLSQKQAPESHPSHHISPLPKASQPNTPETIKSNAATVNMATTFSTAYRTSSGLVMSKPS